jgi:hypothetical protein
VFPFPGLLFIGTTYLARLARGRPESSDINFSFASDQRDHLQLFRFSLQFSATVCHLFPLISRPVVDGCLLVCCRHNSDVSISARFVSACGAIRATPLTLFHDGLVMS